MLASVRGTSDYKALLRSQSLLRGESLPTSVREPSWFCFISPGFVSSFKISLCFVVFAVIFRFSRISRSGLERFSILIRVSRNRFRFPVFSAFPSLPAPAPVPRSSLLSTSFIVFLYFSLLFYCFSILIRVSIFFFIIISSPDISSVFCSRHLFSLRIHDVRTCTFCTYHTF